MKLSLRIVLVAVILAAMPTVSYAQLYGDKYPSYVSPDSVPHYEKILPACPDTASMNFFNDYVQYQKGKELRNTPRGEQAVRDKELDNFELMLKNFSDVFGMEITQENTPELYNLLYWMKNDVCNGIRRVKKLSFRKRPFVQFREGTLIPEQEESHVMSSSYPSNHAAAGWGIALVLMQLNPVNRDAILQRGYEYGQSRVIVGYHYQSDVDAARLCASSSVLLAEREPFFQKQFAKAQKEFEKNKGK